MKLSRILRSTGNTKTASWFLFKPQINPMLRALSIIVLLCFSLRGWGQQFTISGYVKDERSGETLIGANVYHPSSGFGTSSNTYGFFSITLPADSVELRFSYVGYETVTHRMWLDGNRELDVLLPTSVTLREVVVVGAEVQRIEENTQMSTIDVPIQQIKSIPALLGETDVLKALQLLPGVQSGGEGQSGLYVRGGSPDQNLILLDGVPVYNASHLFGFFSVFNTDAIKDVRLIKGGFPARYGGRLSSVIDITMKEGNNKKLSGVASVGLVASRFTLEGPILSDRTSFIVSARRTYIDVLAAPFIRLANRREEGYRSNVGYYFYDLNAKVNHKISNKDRIFFSIYGGRDKFYFNERFTQLNDFEDYTDTGLGWGNITAAFRWNRQWQPKLFSNTTLTYSGYNLNTSAEFGNKDLRTNNEDRFGLDYIAGIRDWGLKIDFDYLPSPRHSIRFGANLVNHRFNPGIFSLEEVRTASNYEFRQTEGQDMVFAQEGFLYVEDEITVTKSLKVHAGLHLAGFLVQDKLYPSLQPRVSARYLLPGESSVKVSFATMQQFIHLLAFEGIGLPTDLWVPATRQIRPQTSWQIAAGYAKSLKGGYELSLEGYYKEMGNVIAYQDGDGIFDTGDWQERVTQGRGYSYGAELFLQKKRGRLNGWIGYTLSWTMRQFDDLNDGRPFPFRYDRRHDISVVAIYDLSERIDISATWVYGTGNAITLPDAKFIGADQRFDWLQTFEYFGNRNDFRMAPYHRMDFGINFKKQKKHFLRTWSLGAYNLYNNNNPFFVYLGSDNEFDPNTGVNTSTPAFKQVSLFPLIPYVTYTAEF